MAYDYDVDILAALWTGLEDAEEPYASFIADNPTLTNDTAEARILSTIELMRSHMELLASRTEAKLFHESIMKLIRHTAGGSNPFSPDAVNPCAQGNIKFPVFPAGGNFEVIIDGNVTEADSATGGDIDTVVAEVNVSLDALFPAAAEVTTVGFTGADVDGNKGGQYFTLNATNDSTEYYVWLSHAGAAEVTDFTFNTADVDGNQGSNYVTLNSANDGTAYYAWLSHTGQAEVTAISSVADTGGSLGGKYFTLNSAGDATSYYCWMNHPGVAEVTDVNFTAADTGGDQGGKYFTLNSAGDAVNYYAWLSHPGVAEVTTVVFTLSDTGGNQGGKYFTLDSAGDGTEYYAWLSHPGVAEISSVTAIADSGGSLGGTHFTLDSAGDGTEYYCWIDHAATAGIATAAVSGAPAGTVVPGIGAATFDFDITIDGGGLQQLNITTTGDPDYDAIAALMNTAATASASVVFAAGAFLVTSNTTGASSTVVVARGTGVNTDLFLDIETAATVTVTFPAPTDGLAAPVDPAPGALTSITATIAVDDGAATVAGIVRSAIDALGDFSAEAPGNPFLVTNAASGVTTDFADVDTGFTISTTAQGIDAATDPAPGGLTSLPIIYAVGDTATEGIGPAARSSIGGNSDFGTSGASATCVITNAATGVTTDAADVDTSATVENTVQGIDAATDPAPGILVSLPIIYAVGDTAATIGGAARTSIGLNVNFGTSGATTECVITNAAVGATTNAENSASPIAGTVAVTTQGVDAAVDPAPGGGLTALPIAYAVDDDTIEVRDAVKASVGGNADFGAAGTENPFFITNAAVGATTNAADVDTGFTVEVSNPGVDAAADPAPGGTGIPILYSIDDGTPAIAAACITAIGGVGDFGAAGGGSTCSVTNAAIGATTDAADFNTEASVTVTTQGADVAVDPAPGGLTTITAAMTINDTALQLDDAVRIAVTALGDFGASETGPVTITNVGTGPTTDAADVNTEATITTVVQGTDAFGDSVDVTASRTIDGRLQICGQFDNDPSSTPSATSFTLDDAGGGILGPAGMFDGPVKNAIKKIADDGRSLALNSFAGFKRGPNLG